MPKKAKKPIAPVLDIFDFDQTVSMLHTFQNGAINSHENIKSDLPLTHQDKKRVSAIASYHTDHDLITSYIDYHLNKIMTLQDSIKVGKHLILSIYKVVGEETPLLICTLPPENFQTHLTHHKPTGKNKLLETIYTYLKKKGYIDKKTKVNYYDDTQHNVDKAIAEFKKFKLTAHRVNKDQPIFTIDSSGNNHELFKTEKSKSSSNRYSFHHASNDSETDTQSTCCCGFFRRR